MACKVIAMSIPALPAPEPDAATLAARARTTEALVRAGRQIDDVADAQARSARAVRDSWRGPHRSRFDAERARRDAVLAELASRCRLLAGR